MITDHHWTPENPGVDEQYQLCAAGIGGGELCGANYHDHIDIEHPTAETLALCRRFAIQQLKKAIREIDYDTYPDGLLLDAINAIGDYTIVRHRWQDQHPVVRP